MQSQQEPRLSLADFLCAKPGCMQLLQDPVVLNCGCCVCSACRPPLGGSCPRCGALSVTAAFGCSKVRLFSDQRTLQASIAGAQSSIWVGAILVLNPANTVGPSHPNVWSLQEACAVSSDLLCNLEVTLMRPQHDVS